MGLRIWNRGAGPCSCKSVGLWGNVVLCSARGGRGSGGEISAPQNLVPCVQLQEPQFLGCTADTQKTLLGSTLGTQNHSLGYTKYTRKNFFGVRTSIKTDPDMQYMGTSTSLQKGNDSCRRREQEMAQIVQKTSGDILVPI